MIGPPSCKSSVVDRSVIMRRMPVYTELGQFQFTWWELTKLTEIVCTYFRTRPSQESKTFPPELKGAGGGAVG
jgi:hypothetical protein